MVSVPDILWRSRVPPWFIRTVKSEERPRCSDSANIISPPVVFWRLNKPVWKRHRVSAPFRHGSSGFASCVIWWSGFKQVGPGRWLLGNAAAPFLSVICWWNFSVFFLLLRRLHSQTLEHFWRENWVQCEVAAGFRLKEHTSCVCADLL